MLRLQAPGTELPERHILPDLTLDWGDWFFQKEALAPHSCQFHHDQLVCTQAGEEARATISLSLPKHRPTIPLLDLEFLPQIHLCFWKLLYSQRKDNPRDVYPSSRPTGDLRLRSLHWL